MVGDFRKANRVVLCSVMVFLCATMAFFPVLTSGTVTSVIVSKNGPYLDKVLFKVIIQDDQQVSSLLNNEIDMIGDYIDPSFLGTLQEAENIDISEMQRNGYGYISINCAKYPFNITAFRRAVSFALDKEGVSATVWDGLSNPQDSCVPRINPFSIEGQLDYSYYEADVEQGNYLLDQAGFQVNASTGFRTAPNGAAFDVLIECAQSSNIAIDVGQYVADALTKLYIDAESIPTDFYTYLNRLWYHGDFDMVFLGANYNTFDVDWLASEYWSENYNVPFENGPNFRNATYDSWRDQLLNSTDYDDVYEAAIEMQRVWVYQCPMIICYANVLLNAYRTDKFEGFVNSVEDGMNSWWTSYKARLKESAGGSFGGTLRVSNPLDVDTFNFMVSSGYTRYTDDLPWDSLLMHDSDWNIIPWMAESYIIETNADNSSVPTGHTRFTFDLCKTMTWSDGLPLTADDVAYTFNYYLDAPGNPFGYDLIDMVSAYAMDYWTVVIEFNSVSYWHISAIADMPIIPKHVFIEIGLEGWNMWNPNPPVEPMITSGPFNVTDYVPGEYMELSRNPTYFLVL